MKFINRLGYYLGGFAVGLVILAFFLSGKRASCAYGPNARTTKDISSKPLFFNKSAKQQAYVFKLDSALVIDLIKYGDVDFQNSSIHQDSCNIYLIENSYKDQDFKIKVENCEKQARLLSIDTI